MKNIPKKHHFIPRMILKNFADENGYLYFTRKNDNNGIINKLTPANLFHERYLYSKIDENGSLSLETEHYLSKIEGMTEPIFDKSIKSLRSGHNPELDDSELMTVFHFMYIQWKRVPDFQRTFHSKENVEKMFMNAIEDAKKKFPDRLDEINSLAESHDMERIIANAVVDSVQLIGPNASEVFRRRGLSFLKISNMKKSFIIGSHPVIKLGPRGRYDLSNVNSEIWLPISYDVAIGMGNGRQKISVYTMNDHYRIRHLNQTIFRQSSAIAANSQTLIKAIACIR